MVVSLLMLRLNINSRDGIQVALLDLNEEDSRNLNCSAPAPPISAAPNLLAPSATTIQSVLPTVNIAAPVVAAVAALTLSQPVPVGSNWKL
jgi:hypothetical protein